MKFSKGFTLIELLVVIAIIGILSSVVLASLNTARAKGGDAAIKSQLAAIRPQAEIVYDTLGSYGTAFASANCPTASGVSLFGTTTPNNVSNQVNAAINASTGVNTSSWCVSIGTPATAWAMAVTLKTNTSQSWCVDSTGASKLEAAAAGTSAITVASATCI